MFMRTSPQSGFSRPPAHHIPALRDRTSCRNILSFTRTLGLFQKQHCISSIGKSVRLCDGMFRRAWWKRSIKFVAGRQWRDLYAWRIGELRPGVNKFYELADFPCKEYEHRHLSDGACDCDAFRSGHLNPPRLKADVLLTRLLVGSGSPRRSSGLERSQFIQVNPVSISRGTLILSAYRYIPEMRQVPNPIQLRQRAEISHRYFNSTLVGRSPA